MGLVSHPLPDQRRMGGPFAHPGPGPRAPGTGQAVRTIRLAWLGRADPETTAEVFLEQDQARHGVLVLRLKVGAQVEMVGPTGLAPALISTADLSGQTTRLGVRLTGPWAGAENAAGPRLALALISGQRFDWAVEKSVELGAALLIPLVSERVKSGAGWPGPTKQDRWRRLAEEARKQCGRALGLDIRPPHTLTELIELPGPAYFLCPSGPSGPPAEPSPLLAVCPEVVVSPDEE